VVVVMVVVVVVVVSVYEFLASKGINVRIQ
jgi:hypothetical protein